jgi:hypothetical protein
MFDDDLETIFADPLINVSAKLGSLSSSGGFDWEDVVESDGGGQVLVSRQVFTHVAGNLGTPAKGAHITIDGQTFAIRDVRRYHRSQEKIVVVGPV